MPMIVLAPLQQVNGWGMRNHQIQSAMHSSKYIITTGSLYSYNIRVDSASYLGWPGYYIVNTDIVAFL